MLQANFLLDSNPDGQDLERIANLTGLSKRVTQVWFQNMRARHKKHMSTGSTPANNNNTISSNNNNNASNKNARRNPAGEPCSSVSFFVFFASCKTRCVPQCSDIMASSAPSRCRRGPKFNWDVGRWDYSAHASSSLSFSVRASERRTPSARRDPAECANTPPPCCKSQMGCPSS